MAKSPGHRKWPDHRVEEHAVRQPMRVEIGGDVVAESSDVVKVTEDDHPDRYYFPRADVRAEALERSPRTTQCPFKGTAAYFHVRAAASRLDNAAWSYEDPYEEHASLKERIAFHDERDDALQVRFR